MVEYKHEKGLSYIHDLLERKTEDVRVARMGRHARHAYERGIDDLKDGLPRFKSRK
jgi:hypothetical protein